MLFQITRMSLKQICSLTSQPPCTTLAHGIVKRFRLPKRLVLRFLQIFFTHMDLSRKLPVIIIAHHDVTHLYDFVTFERTVVGQSCLSISVPFFSRLRFECWTEQADHCFSYAKSISFCHRYILTISANSDKR